MIYFEWDQKDWSNYKKQTRATIDQTRLNIYQAMKQIVALLIRRTQDKIVDKDLIITTTYLRSVNGIVAQIGRDVIEGQVGTWVDYAVFLEFGTKKMKAFRVFNETLEETWPIIERIFSEAIADAMNLKGYTPSE